jgi:DNA-binding response OmpR family regulator
LPAFCSVEPSGRGVFSQVVIKERLRSCELQALRRLQILFVESDSRVHARMELALGAGYIIHSVGSVTEAKAYFSISRPDIVVSEVVVGFEDGLDLCRYIRSVPSLSYLPIMLLTSRATLSDKVAGFQAGTDDYVVKPFDVRHLAARINLLTRIKRLEAHDHP